MAQPNSSELHVNQPLTNLSVAFIQNQANFAAAGVFPIVPVQHQSDVYYEYDRDAWFRSDAEERGDGAETSGTGYTLKATSSYLARVYGVHKMVSDRSRANADSMLRLDTEATEFVTQQSLIKREKLFTTAAFGTGIWTKDLSGVAGAPSANQFKQWDQAGATPIEDVKAQIINVAELTGYKPNTLVLGPRTANALVNNPEIIDRIKYTQPGFPDYQLLATAFGVDRVLVPYATNNTATEGASLSMSMMYGKSALLAYVAPNPGLMTPTAGAIFSWQNYLNAGADVAVTSFYMREKRATRIEAEMAFDIKIIAPDLGVFFASAIA